MDPRGGHYAHGCLRSRQPTPSAWTARTDGDRMANRRRVPLMPAFAVPAFAVPAFAALLFVAPLVITSIPAETATAGTAARVDANSANRVIFWSGCQDLLALRDADLARWRKAGVGGFVCGIQRLY